MFPQAAVMAWAAAFFKEVFQICPNGALPNMKLQAALKATHTKEPIYYHKQPIEDWAQDASESIRQVARYYRHCKESEDQKRTTLKQLRDGTDQKELFSSRLILEHRSHTTRWWQHCSRF